MTHAEDISNIFKAENFDVRPFHGVGFQAAFINNALKNTVPSQRYVAYLQARYDGENTQTLSTNGKIKTVNALITVFANKPIEAVEGMGDIIGRVYKTGNYLTPPFSAWCLGDRIFYFFRPIGGWNEVSDNFGEIWRNEQAFFIQYE